MRHPTADLAARQRACGVAAARVAARFSGLRSLHLAFRRVAHRVICVQIYDPFRLVLVLAESAVNAGATGVAGG